MAFLQTGGINTKCAGRVRRSDWAVAEGDVAHSCVFTQIDVRLAILADGIYTNNSVDASRFALDLGKIGFLLELLTPLPLKLWVWGISHPAQKLGISFFKGGLVGCREDSRHLQIRFTVFQNC